MTDYADIIPIGRFPFRDRDPERVAGDSLAVISEMPEFKEEEHFPEFREGLITALQSSGHIQASTVSKIRSLENTRDIADVLWKDFLIMKYYRQKRKLGWIPNYLKYVKLDHKDFDQDYFNDHALAGLRRSYDINNREIEEARQRLKKSAISHREELRELQWIRDNQGEWKRQLMAKDMRIRKTQAQNHIEVKLERLESLHREYADWVERQEDQIKHSQINNTGLEETQFTVEGILALIRSQKYLKEFRSGISYDHKYADLQFGRNSQDLGLLKEYLRGEISFLKKVASKASAQESSEIKKNLEVAKARYEKLTQMGPFGFHIKMRENPEFLLQYYMLPYYSRTIDTSPEVMDQKQYQKFADKIKKLVAEGKIAR